MVFYGYLREPLNTNILKLKQLGLLLLYFYIARAKGNSSRLKIQCYTLSILYEYQCTIAFKNAKYRYGSFIKKNQFISTGSIFGKPF